MALVAANPNKYIDAFSEDFETLFLELLSRRFGEKRVNANQVYQEYIAERHHIHMNATMWTSLTSFVKYLGRTKKCVVDETERGWFIQWIKRDADGIATREAQKRKERAVMDEESRAAKFLRKQVEIAEAVTKNATETELRDYNLKREGNDKTQRVTMSLKRNENYKRTKKRAMSSMMCDATESKSTKQTKTREEGSSSKKAKRISALDELMQREQRERDRRDREKSAKSTHVNVKNDEIVASSSSEKAWLAKDIVVKVMAKKLAHGRFYKKKGVVLDVQDEFVAKIRMYDDKKTVIRIDQDDLETVIPALRGTVLILRGRGRGRVATLVEIDQGRYKAVVRIADGNGGVLHKEYEDVCKLVR